MNESRLVQKGEAVEQLLGKDSDQGGAEATELVLLDELVQIDTKQLEDKTEVLPVNECIFQSQEVMIVVFVEFCVELGNS